MRGLHALLCISTCLLLSVPAIKAQDGALEPRYALNPPRARYPREDEILVRRNEEIQRNLVDTRPIGVRKMSEDESEMFFLEYWQFQEQEGLSMGQIDRRRPPDIERLRREEQENGNSSIPLLPQLPFLLHSEQPTTPYDLFKRLPLGLFPSLDKRDFQCPTGTSSCTSINQPMSCCPNGNTCVVVQDTGLGTVGCCPGGQTCSGEVQGCSAGYTACSSSSGGGCCIPGFQCAGAGCTS